MRFLIFALCLSACNYDPCADRGTHTAALIGGGGLVGLAIALQCSPPEQPQPHPQPVPVEEQVAPAPADMGVAADLAQLPPSDMAPLTCGPNFVISLDPKGMKYCAPDRDGDGVPDALDRCPTTPAGSNPDSDPTRRGCPVPGFYAIDGHVLNAESGSWSLVNNVWTSAPVYDWVAFCPIPSVLTMRIDLAQTDPADLTITEFSWTGMLDLGQPTTQPECMVLKNGGLYDFPANPSDPTTHTCELRSLQALIYDEKGMPLGGGAECAPIQGLHMVNCKMPIGVEVPLPAGSTYFLVKFLATGTVSLSGVQVSGKVQVSLH